MGKNNGAAFAPVIKWSGSKRSQVSTILKHIPKFNKYYEPFVGGGSVTYALSPSSGVCGDICAPLIELWDAIKTSPLQLADEYSKRWNMLQQEGYQTYYIIRDRFNATPNADDLLFLSRTCVNGLIRFNKNGEFNNSLHHTRKGINPDTLKDILLDWSNHIQGISFISGDYRETTESVTKEDFVYLDPPYFNTRGRYYGTIDYDQFLEYLTMLNSKNIRYALSFDGSRGDTNYMVDLPKELYKQHILISSGNASFKKVMDGRSEQVTESLYLNY